MKRIAKLINQIRAQNYCHCMSLATWSWSALIVNAFQFQQFWRLPVAFECNKDIFGKILKLALIGYGVDRILHLMVAGIIIIIITGLHILLSPLQN